MRIKQDLVPLPDNAIEVIDLFCYEEFSDSEDDEPEPEPELRIDFVPVIAPIVRRHGS